MIRLVLPWAVLASSNGRLNRVGDRLRDSRRYRARMRDARMLAALYAPRAPLAVPVRLTLAFYEPDRRRRDPANYVKLIADAMTGYVYDDDSQIHALEWRRAGVDTAEPRVEIEVEEMED